MRAPRATPPAAAGQLVEGRVIAVYGRRQVVALDDGTPVEAVRRGKRGDAVVGDRVACRLGSGEAVIESIADRASLLFRADAVRTKPLAANVDQVAIVFAPRPPFSRDFLWRALLAAAAAGIEAIAVLNKSDLPDEGGVAALAQLGDLGARTLRVSARTDPEQARSTLRPALAGRRTLLVGQSGMGKSTLLNLLLGTTTRTGELTRHGGRGRQTTTASHWHAWDGDSALVDTPGFEAFGLGHLSARELPALMPDFAPLLGQCRFSDCRHLEEPDCAVRRAVDSGALSGERYRFFRGLSLAA